MDNLNFSKAEWCEHYSQHHIDCGDHCRLCQKCYFLVFHIQFSFSFVLRVEGHEHSIHFTPGIGETLVRPYFSGFCNVG